MGLNCAMIHLNIGIEKDFKGLIDVIEGEAIYFEGENGENIKRVPIPDEFVELRNQKFEELVGCLADVDEEIEELFLMEERPTSEQLHAAIRRSVIARKFQPVLLGSALKNKGVQLLLDSVLSYLPQPDEVKNKANRALDKSGEETEEIIMNPERSATSPPVALAFKLEKGTFGQLTYMRMYQGHLKKGASLTNTRNGKSVRINRLVKMHSSEMVDVDEVYAGDIFATFGVDCASGDTFAASSLSNLSMESMHVPEGVVSMSLAPKNEKKTQNFLKALTRFANEDPSFRWVFDRDMEEYIMTGMGELHLEIYAQRMEREYDCPVELGQPKVAFRETLLPGQVHFDFLHKRQSGGRGQYGRAIGSVDVNPESNTKNVFTDKLVGTNLSRGYLKPIVQGMEEIFAKGPTIGAPMVGMQVTITDGAEHNTDSSEIAFLNCGKGCAEQVFDRIGRTVIEPIMSVDVTFPVEFNERVMQYLMTKHAELGEIEEDHLYKNIACEVPLNDMFGFTAGLRGCTEGKGEFSMEFSHYDYCRDEVIEELSEKYQAELAAPKVTKKKKK